MLNDYILSFFARTFTGEPVMIDGEPLAVDLKVTVAGRNVRTRRANLGACVAHAIGNNAVLRFMSANHGTTHFAVVGGDIRGELVLGFSGECVEVCGGGTVPVCVPREFLDVDYAASLYPQRREREYVGGGFFKDII